MCSVGRLLPGRLYALSTLTSGSGAGACVVARGIQQKFYLHQSSQPLTTFVNANVKSRKEDRGISGKNVDVVSEGDVLESADRVRHGRGGPADRQLLLRLMDQPHCVLSFPHMGTLTACFDMCAAFRVRPTRDFWNQWCLAVMQSRLVQDSRPEMERQFSLILDAYKDFQLYGFSLPWNLLESVISESISRPWLTNILMRCSNMQLRDEKLFRQVEQRLLSISADIGEPFKLMQVIRVIRASANLNIPTQHNWFETMLKMLIDINFESDERFPLLNLLHALTVHETLLAPGSVPPDVLSYILSTLVRAHRIKSLASLVTVRRAHLVFGDECFRQTGLLAEFSRTQVRPTQFVRVNNRIFVTDACAYCEWVDLKHQRCTVLSFPFYYGTDGNVSHDKYSTKSDLAIYLFRQAGYTVDVQFMVEKT